MTSTFGVAGPLAGFDDKGLEKIKRSRLSLHVKTRHVRRWLLVQLVSVPTDDAESTDERSLWQTQHAHQHRQPGLDSLVIAYCLAQPTRMRI